MIRYLVLCPVIVVLATAAGWAGCLATGANPRLREMLLACGICLVAAESALLPALMQNRDKTAAVFQAALVGTVIHLLVILALSVVVIFLVRPPAAFVFWVLALYWITLAVLCVAFARMLRRPVGTALREN